MISITLPVFNEEESLPRLRERLVAQPSKVAYQDIVIVTTQSLDAQVLQKRNGEKDTIQ